MSISPIERVKNILAQKKMDSYEMVPLGTPMSFAHYQNWLSQGHHGEMKYMADNHDVREKPADHFKPMQSIIVFTQNYFPVAERPTKAFKSLRTAHYAQSQDYHLWLREKLNLIIEELKEEFPNESFLAFTDAVPLLERDYGAQANLGWIGKNTCLIHPKQGSLFFIAEILTSIDCDQKFSPMNDFCGSCTACLDQCPTQAITAPRVLDATKCISYWNIESKKVPPVEMRTKMQDWFFGCDICQSVCPWNIKLHKHSEGFVQKSGSPQELEEDLRFILTQSNKKLVRSIKDTPLSRAGGRGLKRNALIVIANLKLTPLLPEVETFIGHQSLGELALWTKAQLTDP